MSGYFRTALLLGLMTGLIVVIGGVLGGRAGMTIALVLAAGMNFFSYWFSDRIVLKMTRARQIGRQDSPQLFEMVETLASRAGIPMPKVYVTPEAAPNAFATGRNPEHAAVAVTRGLLETMSADELAGVLAHELGHIKNRDILISSIAATLAGAIAYVASMAKWAMIFGGRGGRDDAGGGIVGMLATIILAPIAAVVIQMAISRTREYAADTAGSEIAGNPYGLAQALEKLDSAAKRVPMHGTPAANHLYIVQPLTGGGLSRLFSTHPPIQERIRRLTGR